MRTKTSTYIIQNRNQNQFSKKKSFINYVFIKKKQHNWDILYAHIQEGLFLSSGPKVVNNQSIISMLDIQFTLGKVEIFYVLHCIYSYIISSIK